MRDGRRAPVVYLVSAGGVGARGGIGRLVSSTVRYWDAHGLRPGLRVIDPYGPRLSAATPLYFLRALLQVGWNGWRGRIGVLHVYMAMRGSAVRKGIIIGLAHRLGVPVLLHMQGSHLDEIYPRLPGWVRRLLHNVFDAAGSVVAPGTYWRGVLIDMVGLDPRKVHVLVNAIDGPPALPARAPGAVCELVFLGAMKTAKGLGDLLRALAHPDLAPLAWRLRAAGHGDLRPFVEQAAALGIADRVEFLGWISEPEVHALLADSDLFVFPSHNEGLSLALLEAMAHGCAVITTPVGATLDAVADGESALLVPVADPDQLAAALRRAIADTALRARLRANAWRRWHAHFAIAAHCRRLRELYAILRPGLADAAGAAAPSPSGRAARDGADG